MSTPYVYPLEVAVDTTAGSTIVLKGVAKIAGGVVSVGQTTYDVYTDYKTYGGLTENFAKAASADIGTTVAIGIGSTVAVASGAPVIAVSLIGGGVVYLVNKNIINPWKETLN